MLFKLPVKAFFGAAEINFWIKTKPFIENLSFTGKAASNQFVCYDSTP